MQSSKWRKQIISKPTPLNHSITLSQLSLCYKDNIFLTANRLWCIVLRLIWIYVPSFILYFQSLFLCMCVCVYTNTVFALTPLSSFNPQSLLLLIDLKRSDLQYVYWSSNSQLVKKYRIRSVYIRIQNKGFRGSVGIILSTSQDTYHVPIGNIMHIMLSCTRNDTRFFVSFNPDWYVCICAHV